MKNNMVEDGSTEQEVHRVRISRGNWNNLEQLTKHYNCFYNGKLSPSGLLSQIAEGRLIISRPETISEKSVASHFPLIELRIKVRSNLNGTLAVIAEKIAAHGGNIYTARAADSIASDYISMHISMPKGGDLLTLMNSLYDIEVGSVINFNEDDRLEELLQAVDQDYYKSYNENKVEKIKSLFLEGHPKNFKEKKMVTDILITVGFHLVLKNDSGNLSKLTERIAKKRISISSISIEYDSNKDKSSIKLMLGFRPTSEVFEKVVSIRNFMDSLNSFTFVTSVTQIDSDRFLSD